MDDILVGDIEENSNETIKASISEFSGKRILDSRVFFTSEDGKLIPSKKSLAISAEKLPQLIQLLTQAVKMAEQEEVKNDGRITLQLHSVLTNSPCAICGARCDPNGFDFCLHGTTHVVCDECAKQKAPEIYGIREQAEEGMKHQGGRDAIFDSLDSLKLRIKHLAEWIGSEYQTFLHAGFSDKQFRSGAPNSTERIVGDIAGYFNAISLVRDELYDLFREEFYPPELPQPEPTDSEDFPFQNCQ
jgi:hypothetical protein